MAKWKLVRWSKMKARTNKLATIIIVGGIDLTVTSSLFFLGEAYLVLVGLVILAGLVYLFRYVYYQPI